MKLLNLFKSVLEQDTSPVVICDMDHTIVYMNPVACRHYEKWGGQALLGKDLLNCHNEKSREQIKKILAWFEKAPENNSVHTFYNSKENKDVYMIALRDDAGNLIGYYEKHAYRDRDPEPMYAMGQ